MAKKKKAVPADAKVDSTLKKGLLILENLSASSGSKGVTELTRELGLTKSNTFRLLKTLVTLGYVKRLPDKTYAATLKTWQVGRELVENLNLRELAHPIMQHLSDETGEAIYLAVPENNTVVYIDKIDGKKSIRSWNPIGGSAPLHCVGTGKAILAAQYDTLRDVVAGSLEQYTALTITDLAALDKDVKITLERGYAFDTGEFRERILSFGAVICMPDGEVIGALGISMPDVNLPEGDEGRMGSLVAHGAQSLSQKLTSM